MEDVDLFPEEPEATREAIMKATYQALCEHGYAGLTISRIAEDFEKSKSLLYHHYDSKDELLLDFLSFMLDQFEQAVPAERNNPADERLDAVFEASLAPNNDEKRLQFMQAMTELRAQAAHDERYRAHFTDHDRVFRETLVEILEDGIAEGTFRDVPTDRVASFLVAALSGGMNLMATGETGQETARLEELQAYVNARLEAE